MSYLSSGSIFLDAKLTNIGREKIASGDFSIKYFQIGDSEFDYTSPFNELSGVYSQKIISSMDKDSVVKYPYLLYSGATTGVTIGTAIMSSYKETLLENTTSTNWNLNIVWTGLPIGTNSSLSTYQSSPYVSTKEFFGYTASEGQITNTGTTITNSFNEKIVVTPEEQHSIAILHYTKSTENLYDDYINTDTYFKITIPNILYERNISTTVGCNFYMDTSDYYINSSAIDSWSNRIRYRYLIDENGNRVGKIFVDHQIIVFDDQELVAVLDGSSSRRSYTLPIPKISYVPSDIKCNVIGTDGYPLLEGDTSSKTYYVTYLFETDGVGEIMPCNYYLKIPGLTNETSDISIKFGDNDFKFMSNVAGEYRYMAKRFYVLFQEVNNGEQPNSQNWIKIDFTNEVKNISETYINPDNLRGTRFIINGFDVSYGQNYTSLLGGFGSNQIFPGTVTLNRATDINVMKCLVNLPNGQFNTTQNPTYHDNVKKFITEVHLLDDNFNCVVSGKFSTPIERIGNQVISVKLDI